MTVDSADTLSILVATDNHLGYMERDPVRGQDSFHAFAEILQLAHAHGADMVLLGGDLFHDNRPSRRCLHHAMSLLRARCLGAAPVALEHLSDPAVDFGAQAAHVNYEDPNVNVALPVFSIHGNHDDPSGDGNLSAMDMLAVSGLVNYFGRQPEVDNIRVSPVLLRKGRTHLALYGLGNVRDERLHRTMARKHMTMCQPAEHAGRWFNLMVLHQNRVAHGPKNHIPEHFLSGFLDLVVWGHEHQCQVDPEYNHQKAFYVTQPGSSVATALSTGEAVPKHVAMLHIDRRNFKLDKLRLKNVRPFVIEDVVLAAVPSLSPQSSEAEIVDFLRRRVEAMIARAQKQYAEQLAAGHAGIESALGEQPRPLVRVRVEYSGGFESFHPQRFGLLFADRVANPRDIVYFYRKPRASSMGSQRTTSLHTQDSATQDSASRASVPAPVDAVHVESLISEFLDDSSMQMLVDLELAEAIRLFVQKGDNDAIAQSLRSTLSDTQKRLLRSSEPVKEGSLDSQIAQTRSMRRQAAEASGHGMVATSRDDKMVSVTLAGKRAAINQADRKAIKAFEQIASTADNPGDAAAAAAASEPTNDDKSAAIEYSDSSGDEGRQKDDDDFRAAGEDINPTKRGRATRAVSTRGRTSAAPAKRNQTITSMRRVAAKHTAPEPGPKTESKFGSDDASDALAAVQIDSSDDDSDDAFVATAKPASRVSRPSRNARSTLVASATSSVANSTDEEGPSVAETPRAPKRLRVAATVETSEIESSVPPAAPPKPRGRGRGRGAARATATKRTTTATRRTQRVGTQNSSSSQAPVALDINDDDDDSSGKEGTGFGHFSLRKR